MWPRSAVTAFAFGAAFLAVLTVATCDSLTTCKQSPKSPPCRFNCGSTSYCLGAQAEQMQRCPSDTQKCKGVVVSICRDVECNGRPGVMACKNGTKPLLMRDNVIIKEYVSQSSGKYIEFTPNGSTSFKLRVFFRNSSSATCNGEFESLCVVEVYIGASDDCGDGGPTSSAPALKVILPSIIVPLGVIFFLVVVIGMVICCFCYKRYKCTKCNKREKYSSIPSRCRSSESKL